MTDSTTPSKHAFLITHSPRLLFGVNAVMALVYFAVLAFFFPIGNKILFALLIAGEVFHLWQVFTFLYTVWDTSYLPPQEADHAPSIDIFITVAGEPVEIVEETARAAIAMRYRGKKLVHILNDGYVAKKENWREIEALASRLGIHCITRTKAGGAKAGNINNALRLTKGELVAIFDADHVPHEDFLEKTVPYFIDPMMGFVQTPQFYKNHATNYLTKGSWEQQELFFGPICKGKNRHNAATMCGTNMVISLQALNEVGGMVAESIAEDFVTGLLIHARKYKSVFVGEVLAEGLATEDLLSYSKQQFRWARGALDVLFSYNPLFTRGLSWPQRIEYLASASFYLSGIVILIDALLPIVFFYTGLVPVEISGMLLAAIFLPYFFVTLRSIQAASNFTFSFPSLGFSMGAFWLHIRAFTSAVTGQKASFAITPKQAQRGNFLPLVIPHIAYILLALGGVAVAFMREGFSASLVNNVAWAAVNGAVFFSFIRAALPPRQNRTPGTPDSQKKLSGDKYPERIKEAGAFLKRLYE